MLRSTSKLILSHFLNGFESRSGAGISRIHTASCLNNYNNLAKGEYVFPESNADVEVSTAEWEFVERLMPMKFIPKPDVEPGTVAASGWKAPSAKRSDYPYYVMRNRSHMFRLYKDTILHPIKITTKLKGIEGDIFALGDELRKYLLPRSGKRCIVLRVIEPHGVIVIKGDMKNLVTDFLHGKGF